MVDQEVKSERRRENEIWRESSRAEWKKQEEFLLSMQLVDLPLWINKA